MSGARGGCYDRPVPDSSTPRPLPGFALQQLDDDTLLYHAESTRTIHLNETAALIWQLCNGKRSTEDIIAVLQDAYPEDAADIPRDVELVLHRLASDRAIEFA